MGTARLQACWQIIGQTEDGKRRDVFALLDGARVRVLPAALHEQGVEYACLPGGEMDAQTLTRSPYLVRVPADSATARWLDEKGWGDSWGIYVLGLPGAEMSFDTLLRDFRDAAQARLPDGRVVAFRFFDPRVWRDFFPTCDERQLRTLFGRAVGAVACESPDGDALWLDTMENHRPKRRIHLLPHD